MKKKSCMTFWRGDPIFKKKITTTIRWETHFWIRSISKWQKSVIIIYLFVKFTVWYSRVIEIAKQLKKKRITTQRKRICFNFIGWSNQFHKHRTSDIIIIKSNLYPKFYMELLEMMIQGIWWKNEFESSCNVRKKGYFKDIKAEWMIPTFAKK